MDVTRLSSSAASWAAKVDRKRGPAAVSTRFHLRTIASRLRLQRSCCIVAQRPAECSLVTSTSIDASGANLTITVKNNGQTPLANFKDMDVVLQYFGETATRFDKWIPYTSGPLASDTWKTGTFTNDVFEPGILNAGESMELLIRVNPVVGPATTNLAVIGSEKGVTVQTYFAGPP